MVLALGVIVTVTFSASFALEHPRSSMPIAPFAAYFLAMAVGFLAMTPLVARSSTLDMSDVCALTAVMFLFGLGLRLTLLASTPILEVDFNRYLWDGALTAHGFNPYAIAPADVSRLPYDDLRLELAKASGTLFENISYPELKTIYPPVAQATFALAYYFAPWSLTAWRIICIAADVATFALIVALLAACRRSPLWAVLYWWNPLVLKELANSAHMEAILLPQVLAALLLVVRRRHLSAALVLGLAIGTKLWPVLLIPLILRPLVGAPLRLATALLILAGLGIACALPVWLGGIGQTSGFVGFATQWTTNSALFPLLERAATALLAPISPSPVLPGLLVRTAAALAIAVAALVLAWRPIAGARDLVARATGTMTVLLLLSPAQFPWYVLWVLPFAVLQPGHGWHVAAAVMPLYYTAFHFHTTGTYAVFERYVVWALWLPIWLALAADVRRAMRTPRPTASAA